MINISKIVDTQNLNEGQLDKCTHPSANKNTGPGSREIKITICIKGPPKLEMSIELARAN